jgi:CheY-specific phosphatase CheX
MDSAIHPLKRASLKILEEWGLMLIDEAEQTAELFEREEPVMMSWIYLHGKLTGAVSIVAQAPFLKALAANVLGQDSEAGISDDDCTDAFKELGNVLAGNFLTEAYGEDSVFDLLEPNVQEINFQDLELFLKREIVFCFLADETPIAVTVSVIR